MLSWRYQLGGYEAKNHNRNINLTNGNKGIKMKKVKSMMAATVAILLTTLTVRAESVVNNEYQAVVNTAYNYFNGVAMGDQSLLNASFDMDFGDVKMLTVDKKTKKETIRIVPFKEFAGYFSKETEDSWQAKIISIDIVDDKMAMVKMDFTTTKTHYIDYLVMYKRDNKWRIINKTFIAKKK